MISNRIGMGKCHCYLAANNGLNRVIPHSQDAGGREING